MFVIDDEYKSNCINLTGVTLDEGDLQLFAQPREQIEAYYREKARATQKPKAVVTPSAPPKVTPEPVTVVPPLKSEPVTVAPSPKSEPVSVTKASEPQAAPIAPPESFSELHRVQIRNAKLNTLYLCLKIGLLVAAVGVLLWLLLMGRADVLTELLPWIL